MYRSVFGWWKWADPTPANLPSRFRQPHDAYPDRRGHDVSPHPDYVMGLMRGVIDPELGSDIVELGMAKGATVTDDGWVRLQIDLTTSGCPLRPDPKGHRARLTSLPGVTRVTIDWGELTQDERSEAMAKARFNVSQNAPDTSIPSTTKVVMVASGKRRCRQIVDHHQPGCGTRRAGVRRRSDGRRHLGLLGPRMLGVDGDLVSKDGKIQPLVREIGTGRLEVVSMGFLVDQEDSALMWRGLMLNRPSSTSVRTSPGRAISTTS